MPSTELPSEPEIGELNYSNLLKLSQTHSIDSETKGPLSVCVVDGLYSVHSPKGNKVLVGIELSRKEKFQSDSVPRLDEKKLSPRKRKDDRTSGKEGVDSDSSIAAREPIPCPRESKQLKKFSSFQKPEVHDTPLNSLVHTLSVDTNSQLQSADTVIYSTIRKAPKKTNKDIEIEVKVVEVPGKGEISKKESPVKEESGPVIKSVESSYCNVVSGRKKLDTFQHKGEVEEVLIVSVNEPETVTEFKNTIRTPTRVPSFECTCEGGLDDTSPEPLCTCVSPIGLYSEDSKRTSHYQSAELAIHSSNLDSNQVSQELTANQELINTESIFSSGEEFKSGGTSPFYSPRADSPEMVSASKNSSKMDKEVIIFLSSSFNVRNFCGLKFVN